MRTWFAFAVLGLQLFGNDRAAVAAASPSTVGPTDEAGKSAGKSAAKPASKTADPPGAVASAAASKRGAKYHFKITEVRAAPGVAARLRAETKEIAREVLAKELADRPQFTAEPARAGARAYDVSLQIEELTEELKAPRPGGRLKQLAVDVRVTVFGTTLPDAKLAFSGEGQAGVEAEIIERRREEEGAGLAKDALGQAVRQAVDEAVAKLSRPVSQPANEGKRKRRP